MDELAADGVIIKTRMWAPSEVWWDVRTTMLWKIKYALEEDGMEIPFPPSAPSGSTREKKTTHHPNQPPLKETMLSKTAYRRANHPPRPFSKKPFPKKNVRTI
ncbi:mechanosensitive ion channel family protein [Methanogenium cariaci]|uniref:mechanosensitive ion channel family protein n=1 Tax=Methanogenium cariaci TaxID=2197 RepID=UPI001C47C6B6|nr:mechanosensitive ion channel family protein [Methanogenium cariaci]